MMSFDEQSAIETVARECMFSFCPCNGYYEDSNPQPSQILPCSECTHSKQWHYGPQLWDPMATSLADPFQKPINPEEIDMAPAALPSANIDINVTAVYSGRNDRKSKFRIQDDLGRMDRKSKMKIQGADQSDQVSETESLRRPHFVDRPQAPRFPPPPIPPPEALSSDPANIDVNNFIVTAAKRYRAKNAKEMRYVGWVRSATFICAYFKSQRLAYLIFLVWKRVTLCWY